jgi:predicted nucleic acid-binding protein
MLRRVYIETTIPSFYHEVRTEPDMIARRQWTREWWDQQRRHYEVVTSLPVLEELERGQHPYRADALELVARLPLLPVVDAIEEVVDTYIERRVMPSDPRGDALHLALASYHRCHFLLTWNCAHLANANKFEHIRHVNALLGLAVPVLITPVELLHWEGEDDESR